MARDQRHIFMLFIILYYANYLKTFATCNMLHFIDKLYDVNKCQETGVREGRGNLGIFSTSVATKNSK